MKDREPSMWIVIGAATVALLVMATIMMVGGGVGSGFGTI